MDPFPGDGFLAPEVGEGFGPFFLEGRGGRGGWCGVVGVLGFLPGFFSSFLREMK